MDDIKLYAKITKIDPELRLVEGYASTEAEDSQGEIVSKTAIAQALPDYMKFGNIREMHQAKAAGKTKKASVDDRGLYIQAKIVADDAWNLVREGVYSGFSIGGKVKTKIKNKITGLDLTEISLVDRPANPEAVFTMFKIDNSGNISDFNKETMNKKNEEIIIKQDEVVEEPKEEVMEEPKEEVIEKAKKKEEEVVVEEEKEVVMDEVQEPVTKMISELSEKLDVIIAKISEEPAEKAEIVAKVDGLADEVKSLKEQKLPIKAQASYVVEKVEESEDEKLRTELTKIQGEIQKYREQGVGAPVELMDRGFEILSKLD
jgi:HK97 family phage prohead protease